MLALSLKFINIVKNNKILTLLSDSKLAFHHMMYFSVQYGDHDPANYRTGRLGNEDLLPQRVIDQYQMTPQMWEDRIQEWYADHKGMAR